MFATFIDFHINQLKNQKLTAKAIWTNNKIKIGIAIENNILLAKIWFNKVVNGQTKQIFWKKLLFTMESAAAADSSQSNINRIYISKDNCKIRKNT